MADGTTAGLDAAPHELPHNIEAEQALLGALLVNNDVFDRVASIVQPAHFFDPVHARIFEVAAERIRKNALATPVTNSRRNRDGAAADSSSPSAGSGTNRCARATRPPPSRCSATGSMPAP